MRARTLSNVLTFVTAGSVVAASPTVHKHHRHASHIEGRSPDNVNTVNVPGPTIVAYEMNGHPMDQDEVCKGINDGSLKWAGGTENVPDCSAGRQSVSGPAHMSTVQVTVPTSASTISTLSESSTKTQPIPQEAKATKSDTSHMFSESKPPSKSSTTIEATEPSAKAPTTTAYQPHPSPSPAGAIPNGQAVDRDFPDDTIKCSDFPSDYGPVKIDWTRLGGWTGIQYVTIVGKSITHIDTAVPGGDGCKPGSMCSYACPPGYQKSQWPSAQGTTGQSVGGLKCNQNGRLSLTNPTLSKKLCIPGTGAVTVQNKLSNNAAICRTDYPGTENEVVPLNTQPATTNPLTCPDAGTYYKHEGSSTTAQYYINNQGVPVQNACIWGADGTNMGNWAPSYLGVGQDVYGKTWLAISSTAQNNPSNYKPLNFTIEIVGNTSGKCKLSQGKYCSGDKYDDCNDQGCTVELVSGHASYVLSD